MQSSPWHLVVPVKRLDAAKSRLQPLGARERRALARAFATDTLLVASGVVGAGQVAVVTDDEEIAQAARDTGLVVVADPGEGLNTAIGAGLRHWGSAVARGVLLADLPALTRTDLTAALDLAAQHPLAAVQDAEGTGTVLLTARSGIDVEPAFGSGSAQAHARAGAGLLSPDLPRLRRDVDHLDGLREALCLGLAPASAAAVAALAWPEG